LTNPLTTNYLDIPVKVWYTLIVQVQLVNGLLTKHFSFKWMN